MSKKTILVLSFLFFLSLSGKAENSNICKAAQDSMNAQFGRGELAFYFSLKSNSKIFFYVKINKDYYQKTPTKNASGAKDSTKKDSSKTMSAKLITDYFQGKSAKTQPLDTSVEFKMCYNLAFQSKLDSVYKCDFFRKSDSIMRAYDKLGKGYKNVDYPGGAGALQTFMEKNVSLPKEAKPSDTDNLIRVYYSFFVDEKGELSEIKMIKSNCKVCEDAVLSAVNKITKFTPATEAGKPKKVKYILPFTKKI